MPRPTTKAELLAAAADEYGRLNDAVRRLPPDVLEDVAWQADIADQSRNPRDVWCHLHAWHVMTSEWVTEGAAGRTPAVPGEGLTWREMPVLNARIWERYRDTTWPDATRLLDASHAGMMRLIDAQPASLFDKGVLAWTGSTSVGAYLVSATSSHYAWGVKTLRAIERARARGRGDAAVET